MGISCSDECRDEGKQQRRVETSARRCAPREKWIGGMGDLLSLMPSDLLEVSGEGLVLLLGFGDDSTGTAIPEVLVAEDGHTHALVQRFGILEGTEHDILVAAPLVLAGGTRVVVYAREGFAEAESKVPLHSRPAHTKQAKE